MLAALKSGAIDVMVAWETNNAQAKAEGLGDYSPVVDLQQGKIGNQTSVMYATDEAIKSKPEAVQAMVDCLVQRTKELSSDVDAWKAVALEKTGVKPEVADIAVTQVEMDANLYVDSVRQVIKTFAEHGLIKDSSDKVDGMVDWSFLEQATGKTQEELSQ
jgi:ABC-type nitrate/sulfonate/bicarbonate transport system substrate-binding protein